MKINCKKIIALLTCLLFVTTALSGSSALTIKKQETDIIEQTEEETITKKVILNRVGVDGEITPIEINLSYSENEDFSEVLEEKCKQMFFNDSRFMEFFRNITNKIKNFFNRSQNDTNETNGNNTDDNDQNESNQTVPSFIGKAGLLLVSSKGRGFHFQPKKRVLFKTISVLNPFRRGRINPKTFIFCKYKNNRAETKITPLVRSAIFGSNATATMDGKHSMLLLGFCGYTSWLGRFSGLIDILPKTTFGISTMAFCKKA
ncbi:MAG: hypothetical protein V5A64_03635 [Candidatus Thermoplasmatota archaeon]